MIKFFSLLIALSLTIPSYAFLPPECTGWKFREEINGSSLVRVRRLKVTSTNEFINRAERCANVLGYTVTFFYTENDETVFVLKKK